MPDYETVTLAEAWRHWWAVGQLDSETTILWGHRLLWWARAGKVAQTLGGLTAVFELIGAARLRAFGNSLHERFTVRQAKEFLWTAGIILGYFLLSPRKKEVTEEENARTQPNIAFSFMVVLVIVMIVFTWYVDYDAISFFQNKVLNLLSTLVIYVIFGGFVAPILTVLLVLLLVAIGGLIDFLVIEPIAWILEHPRLDRLLQITALILLIVGFHFDFLAS